jgi:hypothetical protein
MTYDLHSSACKSAGLALEEWHAAPKQEPTSTQHMQPSKHLLFVLGELADRPTHRISGTTQPTHNVIAAMPADCQAPVILLQFGEVDSYWHSQYSSYSVQQNTQTSSNVSLS